MDKYKQIEAISMGSDNTLVLSFYGFEDHESVRAFAELIFAKLKMTYTHVHKPHTIH